MTGAEHDVPPWPDDEPRKCQACEKVRHDVRLRIGRGARLLCGPCFEETR